MKRISLIPPIKITISIILLIVCFNSIDVCFSQEIIRYCFAPTNENFIDTSYTSAYESISIERIVINKNEYIDLKILCIGDAPQCAFHYKKDSVGNWFIYFNKWSLFYDVEVLNILKTEIINDSIYIFPVVVKELNIKTKVFGFKTKEIHFHEPENNNVYFFEPNFGIIAIETNQTLLVREDFTEYLKRLSK